jgi:hypothetical protein
VKKITQLRTFLNGLYLFFIGMVFVFAIKKCIMDKNEKRMLMDKVLRELEDTRNTETSVVKKLAQLESENINLGDRFLEKKLPEIFNLVDDALSATIDLQAEYTKVRDRFVQENKLDEINGGQ